MVKYFLILALFTVINSASVNKNLKVSETIEPKPRSIFFPFTFFTEKSEIAKIYETKIAQEIDIDSTVNNGEIGDNENPVLKMVMILHRQLKLFKRAKFYKIKYLHFIQRFKINLRYIT